MTQMMVTDHTLQLLQIGIDACALWLRGLVARGCLLDTKAIGAVVGDVEPSYSGDFQTFFTAPLAAVPEAFKAIGVGAAFGDKAGIDNESLLMVGRNHLGNRCFVECDKVKVSVVPPRKAAFVIRTVAAEITKRGMAGKHQQKSQQVDDEFALWLLGLG